MDNKLLYLKLLIEYKSLNIHLRNLQKRVAVIFKVKNRLPLDFINDVFEFI